MKSLAKKTPDLSKILKPYAGKWVALSDDKKVVGVGSSLQKAWEDSKKHGTEDPILTKAPKDDGTYIL